MLQHMLSGSGALLFVKKLAANICPFIEPFVPFDPTRFGSSLRTSVTVVAEPLWAR